MSAGLDLATGQSILDKLERLSTRISGTVHQDAFCFASDGAGNRRRVGRVAKNLCSMHSVRGRITG